MSAYIAQIPVPVPTSRMFCYEIVSDRWPVMKSNISYLRIAGDWGQEELLVHEHGGNLVAIPMIGSASRCAAIAVYV